MLIARFMIRRRGREVVPLYNVGLLLPAFGRGISSGALFEGCWGGARVALEGAVECRLRVESCLVEDLQHVCPVAAGGFEQAFCLLDPVRVDKIEEVLAERFVDDTGKVVREHRQISGELGKGKSRFQIGFFPAHVGFQSFQRTVVLGLAERR